MIPNTYFGQSKKLVTSLGAVVKQIEGLAGVGAGGYLQLHNSSITPAAGAVPVWEIPISTSTQFFGGFQQDGITCGEGVFVGLSSTSGTYTALVSNIAELTVWLDMPVIATNVVDSGAALPFTVWANDATPESATNSKRMFKFTAVNNSGTDGLIMLYADAGLTQQVGVQMVVPANSQRTFNFGTVGFESKAFSAAGIRSNGLYMQDTSGATYSALWAITN